MTRNKIVVGTAAKQYPCWKLGTFLAITLTYGCTSGADEAKVPSPEDAVNLIQDVSSDKQQVCVGEIVTIRVTAQHPEAEGKAVDVYVDGKMGSPQYLQFTGEPGPRMIQVLATTAERYTDSAEIAVDVVACEERFPILYVRPNPYRNLTVDFQVANANELGEVREYIWSFGDGQTATTSVPYASHFYGDAMSRDELYTVFQAELTVDRADATDLTVHKTVPIWSLYAFNKRRGVIQPPVESSGRLEPNGATLTGTLSIKNPEDHALALRQRWIEYQYCDPELAPTAEAAEAVDIRIEPGAPLDYAVDVPASIAGSGVCGIAVNLTGDAPDGRTTVVTGYFEVQDNPLMRGPVLDAERRDILNQIAAAGLVADPNRITDEELYGLGMAGKMEFPPVDSSQIAFASPPIDGRCQPGEEPPRPGLTCQATQDWEMVAPHIANALKGYIVLSSGCGMVGKLMLHVTPPQKFSHSGLMTKNFFELRHSTAVDDRFQDYSVGILGQPTDGFREDVLKFGWPGTITQSIDAAYNGQRMKDPEPGSDRWYYIDAFTPEPRLCEDDGNMVSPIVIRPPPGAAANPDVQQRLNHGVEQMNSLFGHYRLFSYSNAAIALDAGSAAPKEAGWAEGSLPTVCSSAIWLSMKQAGIELEGALERSDLELGAMVDDETEDGLYLYTEHERMHAANFLYDYIYDKVYAKTGWFKRLLTDAPDDIASQMLNCFGFDRCGEEAKDSAAWQDPGVGRAVSPDDMLFWDAPPFGIYGHNEPLVYRTGRFMRVHQWAPSAGTGTIQGTVRDYFSSPLQDAFIFIPSLAGVEDSTGANGAFELTAVPAGTYEVKAQKLIDGLLFEASALVTVVRGQVATVNLALQPPPRHNRRVRVSGSMRMVDHEVGRDERKTVAILREVDLNPFQTRQEITISDCVGGELRVEIHISLRLLEDYVSVEAVVETFMYEKTSCNNNDLDDEESRSIVVAEDNQGSMMIHLKNTEPFGGDTADIDLSIENRRQN